VSVIRRFGVPLPMRDGVELSADIYRPEVDHPVPALIARTPYNKNTAFAFDKGTWYAEQGFAFVWIDVRGRGDSGGAFAPYRNDGVDGYDAIEWVAAQSWASDRVGTWGQSYLGCIQWLAALERPPHLRAMVVYVTPSDPFVEHPTGTRFLQEVCWYRMVSGRLNQYVDGIDWMDVYAHRPLLTMDERAGYVSEHWRNDLTHGPVDDEYWGPLNYQDRIGTLDVPALHVTGWYDDVQPGTLRNFEQMTRADVGGAARTEQRLVVGPWDHSLTQVRGRHLGAIDFGPDSNFDLNAYEVSFLSRHLKGQPSVADDPPVRIFVMGANTWRDEEEWPLARTSWTPYYLSSGGAANSKQGDGILSRGAAPRDTADRDSFIYDPGNPAPFITSPTSSQIGGPDDYSIIEDRDDILVYSTVPLENEIEVTGPVRVLLFASSSAVETDFVARLIDVHPNGFCQRLSDGLARSRYREGMRTELEIEPGSVYQFEIDIWSTSQVFLPGHQIRLEVTSSAYPKYDPNTNTGVPAATATSFVRAKNVVWHSAEFPSALILPEIPVRTSTLEQLDAERRTR